MKVFITGVTGFVGREVAGSFLAAGHDVQGATRDVEATLREGVRPAFFNDMASHDWRDQLREQDLVVHCAARVHVMNEQSADPLLAFRQVNVEGTLNLARHAAQAGVKRFIFISSIKVNGEETPEGRPFRADDVANPTDPYGVSKFEAEQALLQLSAESSMDVVIIRPVLVYGPGVKANFRSMMSWLARGVPLPLGAVKNKRSLVSVTNLADLVVTCASHPCASNQIFLVSDGEDLSTSDLLRRMATALEKPARLVPVPSVFIEFAARLVGRPGLAIRLCHSLQVDIEKNKQILGWVPPVEVDHALSETARSFREQE